MAQKQGILGSTFPDIRGYTGRAGGALLGVKTAVERGDLNRKFALEERRLGAQESLLGLKMQAAQREQDITNRIFGQGGKTGITREGIEAALKNLPPGASMKVGPINLRGQDTLKSARPSWKQQQEIEAIKTGLRQGVIAVKTEWGGNIFLRFPLLPFNKLSVHCNHFFHMFPPYYAPFIISFPMPANSFSILILRQHSVF